MIEIVIDNDKAFKILDTNDNINISLELNNPMFGNVNDLAKSYSYSFNLPKTPNNDNLLDFPTFINNPVKWIAKNGSVFSNGILLIEGDLVIRSATNNSILISIQVNKKLDWLNVRKMTELTEMGYVWQRITPSWSVDLRLIDTRTGTNSLNQKIEIEINGIKYSTIIIDANDVVDFQNALINLRDLINADTINNNAIATIIVASIKTNFRVSRVNNSLPFYVIPTATTDDHFLVFQYAVEDTVNYDNQAKAWIDNVMANASSYIYRYAELSFMSNGDNGDIFYLNHHQNGTYTFVDDDLSVTSPQIFVKQGLELLLNTFGYKMQSNFLNETDLQSLYFANNHSNAPQNYLGDFEDVESLRFYPEYFFFYCHKFPDKTLLSWLDDFAKLFCLYIDINHRTKMVKIESLNTVLSATTLKEYTTSPDYSLEKINVDKKGYTFSLGKPQPTSGYTNSYKLKNESLYQDLKIDDGAVSIKTNITFLTNIERTPATSRGFVTGWWNSTPNYSTIPYFQSGFSSRFYGERGNANRANALMFYKGFVAPGDKPLSDFSNGNETMQWGIVNLNATYPLYNRRWRRFITLLNKSEMVKRKLYMDIIDFANIDLAQKIRVDNQTYFIKKIRVQLSHSTKTKIVADCDLVLV